MKNLVAEKLVRVVELEEDDEEFHGRRYAEAQMPLPPTPSPESPKLPPADPPIPDPEYQLAVIDNADTAGVLPPVSTDPLWTGTEPEAGPTSTTISSANNADGDATGTDVEALREQLKRFKERFTGSETMDVG